MILEQTIDDWKLRRTEKKFKKNFKKNTKSFLRQLNAMGLDWYIFNFFHYSNNFKGDTVIATRSHKNIMTDELFNTLSKKWDVEVWNRNDIGGITAIKFKGIIK